MAKLIAGSSPARYFKTLMSGSSNPARSTRSSKSSVYLKTSRAPIKYPRDSSLASAWVLLILLYKPEPELPDEVGPGQEGEGDFCGLAFRPALRRVFHHIGHGKMHSFFLRGCAVH